MSLQGCNSFKDGTADVLALKEKINHIWIPEYNKTTRTAGKSWRIQIKKNTGTDLRHLSQKTESELETLLLTILMHIQLPFWETGFTGGCNASVPDYMMFNHIIQFAPKQFPPKTQS